MTDYDIFKHRKSFQFCLGGSECDRYATYFLPLRNHNLCVHAQNAVLAVQPRDCATASVVLSATNGYCNWPTRIR